MSFIRFLLAAVGLALTAGCHPDHAPATAAPPATPHAPPATPAPADTTQVRPEVPRALSPVLHRLIQENFARINAVHEWSAIQERPLYDSTEGGTATYYNFNGQLWKVVAHRYGETGQARTEYYLLHGQPSFVLEMEYQYNRPIYYDAAAMRENHDTEAFDFKKSDSVATRSYFDAAGRLVAQTGLDARDSAKVAGYLAREQHRLHTELDLLRQAANQPRP